MTPDEWRQVKEVLHSVVERDADGRSAFLDEICAGNLELRRRVDALLSAHENMGEFLAQPWQSLSLFGESTLIGLHIGPYQLMSEIGHGGMGTVYLAERADGQYRRRVAIKLINSGLGNKAIVRRFRNERQVLAGLDHPYIARLLDGGATDDGLPYLVMEHVEGNRIDTWCDMRKLSVRERLMVFQKVCSAVQYAHEKQVIHRDIKPGNIVVTAAGTPKLLDFGIAKVLNPELCADGSETTIGCGPMTPEYASPEQVRGGRVGPVSDVYALGVLLYHLLTGQLPYSVRGQDLQEVICKQEPLKPSAVIASAEHTVTEARGESATGLCRLLAGDLDTVVLKSLRKEPESRYSSVQEFSEDLDRFLRDLPVHARKETVTYRSRKFLKRNRALITAVLASVGLVLALVAAWGQIREISDRAGINRAFGRGLTEARQMFTQPCVQPPPGMVSWWPGDGKVSDLLGFNNPSDVNGVSYVPGKIGNGFTFGSGGYIDIPASAKLANQRFTLQAWVRPDGPSTNNDFIGNYIFGQSFDNFHAVGLAWRSYDARFVVEANSQTEDFWSMHAFPAGQFYHVAATYDGSLFSLYVNGVLEGHLATTAPIQYSFRNWTIGSISSEIRVQDYPRTWNGVIDEVQVFNRVLAPNEIQAIVNAPAGVCK